MKKCLCLFMILLISCRGEYMGDGDKSSRSVSGDKEGDKEVVVDDDGIVIEFEPYGFQSGYFGPSKTGTDLGTHSMKRNESDIPTHDAIVDSESESLNDDSFAGSLAYDAVHNLVFFTGSTFGTYFDSATMGFNEKTLPHLPTSDCFLGVVKLPSPGTWSAEDPEATSPPWLKNLEDDEGNPAGRMNEPKLIYARRFGTQQHPEACSALTPLSKVNDALLQSDAQLKLALLGHANPIPPTSGADTGAFMTSLSNEGVVDELGRAYGFVVDFDVSLTLDETFTSTIPIASPHSAYVGHGDNVKHDGSRTFSNAYGALLGGYVLESSPLVYPVSLAQSKRDPNQIYVISMHSDDDHSEVNEEYDYTLQQEFDPKSHSRPDLTTGGGGGTPKYGTDFYVKVQQLTIIPYQTLMNIEPTPSEKIKRTMEAGWGFGFKLNDALDVRPSCLQYVKGKTPNEDFLLLGGTTRKNANSGDDLDGFVTRLVPPSPAPTPDVQTDSHHPTKRIDSATGRDETVTHICLPPAKQEAGQELPITHAYVVGTTTSNELNLHSQPNNGGDEPSLSYIMMMRLSDMSTVWKQHVGAIHPAGIGGNVLGQGCAVTADGTMVYLAGTMDGGSSLTTGMAQTNIGTPRGGLTDTYVVAYDAMFGSPIWTQQFGTVHDDWLARGGGITVDNEGNAIVLGSTRGALQRYRPETNSRRNLQKKHSLASDIFIMALSHKDGSFVQYNVPTEEPTPETTTSNEPSQEKMHVGAVAAIIIASVILSSLFFIYVLRSHHRRYGNEEMMEFDDFSYTHRGGFHLGGYHDQIDPNQEIYDEGEEFIYKSNRSISSSWMVQDNHPSGIHPDIHAPIPPRESLQQQANSTMTQMVHEDDDSYMSDATDPRLDEGKSIKSLLSHYREVRKNKLFETDTNKKKKRPENEMRTEARTEMRTEDVRAENETKEEDTVSATSEGGSAITTSTTSTALASNNVETTSENFTIV